MQPLPYGESSFYNPTLCTEFHAAYILVQYMELRLMGLNILCCNLLLHAVRMTKVVATRVANYQYSYTQKFNMKDLFIPRNLK